MATPLSSSSPIEPLFPCLPASPDRVVLDVWAQWGCTQEQADTLAGQATKRGNELTSNHKVSATEKETKTI